MTPRLASYTSRVGCVLDAAAVSACCCMQVLGNLPFNILVAVLYSGIFYGMCGLRRGPQYFGKFATIVTLLQIIAAQVSSKRLLGWERGLGTAS